MADLNASTGHVIVALQQYFDGIQQLAGSSAGLRGSGFLLRQLTRINLGPSMAPIRQCIGLDPHVMPIDAQATANGSSFHP
jgi:hypothetical protein